MTTVIITLALETLEPIGDDPTWFDMNDISK